MEPDRVAMLGVSASLLELAGWPKPGNVHRTADFANSRFEHFLIGSASLYEPLKSAASGNHRFGELLVRHISLSYSLQTGGNTHLGTAMLLIPLAYAASEWDGRDTGRLAYDASKSLGDTTPEDAVQYYRAIKLSMTQKALGKVKEGKIPDVLDPQAEQKLLQRGINVMDIMRSSADYDMVAYELANGYPKSIEGLKIYNSYADPNVACVNTFLKLFSSYGDTFIARNAGDGENVRDKVKDGLKKISWAREAVAEALNLGGGATEDGRRAAFALDAKLRELGWSPGSVADLLASVIFLALLGGRKI